MKALVAGSAHIDILARPASASAHRDRKGKITFSIGGTACNIAFGLCRAGNQVRLLTAFNDAPITRLIEGHMSAAGVEVMADVVQEMPMAAFVSFLTVDGDLDVAISDTPVEMHEFSAERIEEALSGMDYVVVEANLNPSALAAIAQRAYAKDIPVFGLGVSEDKVDGLLFAAKYLKAAFVNHDECERLMATLKANDHTDVAIQLGAPLMVTRGERGAVVYLPNGERIKIRPAELSTITNVLGVGDAFCAGVIDAMMAYDLDFLGAAEWANAFVPEIAKSEACNAYSMNALNNLVGDLDRHSRIDKITGLDTRRHFEAIYLRHKSSVNCLLLITVDNFKVINDTAGHDTGDQILATVASVITGNLRPTDLSARWGGDKFVALLPGMAIEEAVGIAERMRANMQKQGEQPYDITLSIGVVGSSENETLKTVIGRADDAMYGIICGGGNSVGICEQIQLTVVD